MASRSLCPYVFPLLNAGEIQSYTFSHSQEIMILFIIQVLYDETDIGTTSLTYTESRATVVDFAIVVGPPYIMSITIESAIEYKYSICLYFNDTSIIANCTIVSPDVLKQETSLNVVLLFGLCSFVYLIFGGSNRVTFFQQCYVLQQLLCAPTRLLAAVKSVNILNI